MNHHKLFIFILLGVLAVSLTSLEVKQAHARRPAFSIYTPKQVMITQWKSLCDQHPEYASYEVIGQSVEGRDIWLFAIGNPQGGRVMYDGQLHGWEDGGTELLYAFAEWLLESNQSSAKQILTYNYNLFIPIVNIDTTNRQNMRREYTLSNGAILEVPYGVDLNRNGVYGWGRSGSGDPENNYNYRGLYAGSEPETQAIRNALSKYRPQIYLNTHLGASYVRYHSETPLETKIIELITLHSEEIGVTPYSIRRGLGRGLIATDADESFGASGWLIEIESTENLPETLDGFLEKYYPKVFPILLAFNQATEITDPTVPDSEPTVPETPDEPEYPDPNLPEIPQIPEMPEFPEPVVPEKLPIFALMLVVTAAILVLKVSTKHRTK